MDQFFIAHRAAKPIEQVFTDGSGKLFYVFHTHKSNDTVHNRRTAVAELKAAEQNGKTVFSIDRTSFRFFYVDKNKK